MTDTALIKAAEKLVLAAATILDLDEAGDAEAQSDEWDEGTMDLALACDGLTEAIAAAGSPPAKPTTAEASAKLAVERLREARDLLKSAGASKAVDRVRSAMKSAEGAVRHAVGREMRAYQKDRQFWDAAEREGVAKADGTVDWAR